MGVYIPGMEMPQSCFERALENEEDHFCQGTGLGTLNYQSGTNRPGSCPLIPIPPHGRLIDADALCERLQKAAKIKPYIEGAFNAAISFALTAPTIIPAEEDADNG